MKFLVTSTRGPSDYDGKVMNLITLDELSQFIEKVGDIIISENYSYEKVPKQTMMKQVRDLEVPFKIEIYDWYRE